MSEKVNNNGYNYVDLDLPSGTLWATCNVGASKPSEYGLLFQWGDTQGYTADQVGKDKQFNWANYKWSIDGSSLKFSKYTTDGESLELADDAANANMGGDWHMPTPEQIQELINETDNTWTTQDGVNGRRFTSKNGKSIFIPAAGGAWDGSLGNSGDNGYVWSSALDTYDVYDGQYLSFSSNSVSLYGSRRYYGFSVRGVIDGKCNKNNIIMNETMKKEVSLKKLCCTAITATNLQIMLLESRSLLALCMSNSIKSLTKDNQFKDEKIFVNDKSDTDSYTMELYTNACPILRIGIKINLSKDCSRITPIMMYEVSERTMELIKVIEDTLKEYC